MKSTSWKAAVRLLYLSALFATILISSATGLSERVSVDNSKMGVYRALAQLILNSYKKSDLETAATLGRILDKTWDRIEETGVGGLNKTNPKLFEEIDEAMDAFIKPLIHFDPQKTDSAAVEAAYKAYLDKLKAAD